MFIKSCLLIPQLTSPLPLVLAFLMCAAPRPMEQMSGQRPFPDGPFEGNTNYNADFQKREVGERARFQRPRGVEGDKLPFTGASTYSENFIQRVSKGLQVGQCMCLSVCG